MDPDDGVLSRRGRRAVGLIAAALTVIVVATLLYLRPAGPAKTGFVGVPPLPQLDGRYWPDFDFVTPSLGWAAIADTGANSALIYRTTDGARSWQKQLAVTMHEYESPAIHFFDAAHGVFYAAGLHRTSDGGAHWETISLPDDTPAFSFADAANGWAVDFAQPSRPIYATKDGGLTWRMVGSYPDSAFFGKGGVDLVSFRAGGESWAGYNSSGPTVYATFDGGSTWRAIGLPVPHIPTATPILGKPYFSDFTTSAKLVPGNGVLVEVDSPAGVSEFISVDRGNSWNPIAPPPTSGGLGVISFVDARHWWASRLGVMFTTSDAGRTWRSVASVIDVPGDWTVDTAHAIDARHGWVTMTTQTSFAVRTQARMLLMTSDGGAHWSPVNLPRPA